MGLSLKPVVNKGCNGHGSRPFSSGPPGGFVGRLRSHLGSKHLVRDVVFEYLWFKEHEMRVKDLKKMINQEKDNKTNMDILYLFKEEQNNSKSKKLIGTR